MVQLALDASGRPLFADLMFGRRPPLFVAFDVLVDRGEDVRALPLARRKAVLKRLARGWRSGRSGPGTPFSRTRARVTKFGIRHVDQRLMAAGVVVAEAYKVMHAE